MGALADSREPRARFCGGMDGGLLPDSFPPRTYGRLDAARVQAAKVGFLLIVHPLVDGGTLWWRTETYGAALGSGVCSPRFPYRASPLPEPSPA